MDLPSGTVTFLFTDIEGSTRLWEERPEAMRTALAHHDNLLRQAIEANSGVVFKTMGDAFCAAFATAPEALNAALTAQCALRAPLGQEKLSVRIRMALHTGAAERREADYFGQPLNRVARLLAAGHGGQVLLSEVVQDLTRDLLPDSVTLQCLGEHRLRDLGRPEPVFQLLHPELPAEFPPLKSLSNPALPNNLPQQVTSFIGRAKEIEAVKALLAETHLLTLTGSGGCGKTRLGLQVAAEALDQYPEGAWLVELAPLADPALVPQTVAQALNISAEPGKPVLPTLVEALKTRRLLLVLDNCEHLLLACAQLVDTLIRACPQVRVLASSREGLGIAGETVYRIPSLSLPDLRQTATAASLGPYEAVRLFVERALAASPAFAVTNQNAPALVSVCHRLDGIPLAIELAATRVRSLSLEEINSKLDNCFRLLTGGSRTALPRQQTLRALIDWSYGLLSAQEKTLLCRLAVFAGGWTLEAAETVCTGPEVEVWEVLDLLTSLADKSLVMTEVGAAHTRYRLLETVRQYARERLVEREEAENVWQRHQACFLALAEEAEPSLHGPGSARWLQRLESEHDNLRAAMAWDDREAALRIAGALIRFWEVRGYCTEGRKWLSETLASPENQAHTTARARALNGAGGLARIHGDIADAQTLLEQSLTLYQELEDKKGTANVLLNLGAVLLARGDRVSAQDLHRQSLGVFQELGDRHGIARCLANLGYVLCMQSDFAESRPLLEQGLALYRELGDQKGEAVCLLNLSNIALDTGDFALGQTLTAQYLALYRELGDRLGMAHSLLNLGFIAYEQGDITTAEPYYTQSLALYREIGNRQGIARCLVNLGNIAHRRGDSTTARPLYEQSLALFQELGIHRSIAACLLNLGGLACESGDYALSRSLYTQGLTLRRQADDRHGIASTLEAFAVLEAKRDPSERAPRLWGAAEALREQVGAPLTPAERADYDRAVAEARRAADAEAFAVAWSAGRNLPREQAIQYALQIIE